MSTDPRVREIGGGLRREHVGYRIYEATPDNVNVAYPVVATGAVQYSPDASGFRIGQSFRVNKVEVRHTDGAGADTALPWICDLQIRDRLSGVWRTVFERAVTAGSILYKCGEEYNWIDREVRFRFVAPVDELLYPLFTLQFLSSGGE